MLAVGKSGFNWHYTLDTGATTTPGVSITPGSGSKGSYYQLASGANLSQDCYGFWLWINAGSTSGAARDILIDIGLDPAGGTSYSQLGGISDIFAPQDNSAIYGGRFFYFPLFIKSGTSVGVRAQSNSTSLVRAAAWFFGQPTHPENVPTGQYSETIGVSGNGGTPITLGTSGAWGSWTSLGTTTRPCWYWTAGAGFNTATINSQVVLVELGYGDGTNMVKIVRFNPHWVYGTTESCAGLSVGGFWEVPAGGTLYVRGSSSYSSAQGFEVAAVGIGG
jgi:hypothetical protein